MAVMKIVILALLLTGCSGMETTMKLYDDTGNICAEYSGPRKACLRCGDKLACSSEMLLSQDSVQIITKETAGVIPK
jgi:hypothetical protein